MYNNDDFSCGILFLKNKFFIIIFLNFINTLKCYRNIIYVLLFYHNDKVKLLSYKQILN